MSATSNDTVIAAQRQMQLAAKAIEGMAEAVAAAKQVKEYDSDRRKRVLALGVKFHLDAGESATAAEHKARASDAYESGLIKLSEQYQAAMETIEKADAQRVLFEAARSLLSVEKMKLGLL